MEPYMDNNGAIWVKSGADKRKVTAREEMQRIFQAAGLVHADEVPVNGMTAADVDKDYFKRFFHKQFGESPDALEIPKISLEELVANALVHRDYFISAPIRIFIYDNQVEIISPGHLPTNLTIENIKNGISMIRNPIIASLAAKILPYRGLGNGIRRALKEHPQIEFIDHREGNEFKAILKRI
jgi:predicted HTH transcriptional regulator